MREGFCMRCYGSISNVILEGPSLALGTNTDSNFVPSTREGSYRMTMLRAAFEFRSPAPLWGIVATAILFDKQCPTRGRGYTMISRRSAGTNCRSIRLI